MKQTLKYGKGELPCCHSCTRRECYKGEPCIDFAIHNDLIDDLNAVKKVQLKVI